MKEYRSFEEIDRDLKILKLQNEIDKEEIILNIERTKESLSPMSLLGSLLTSVLQKAIVLKGLAKLMGKKVIDKR